jgi:hypothetical protein
MTDPYPQSPGPRRHGLAFVKKFKDKKAVAREAGLDSGKVPCLGHPVFNKETVNYDPRERIVTAYLEEHKIYNVFLDFYHRLARAMMDSGVTNKVHAVNVDAALTCVLMGIAWPLLVDKKITVQRAVDLPFLAFALGRVAGGPGIPGPPRAGPTWTCASGRQCEFWAGPRLRATMGKSICGS